MIEKRSTGRRERAAAHALQLVRAMTERLGYRLNEVTIVMPSRYLRVRMGRGKAQNGE